MKQYLIILLFITSCINNKPNVVYNTVEYRLSKPYFNKYITHYFVSANGTVYEYRDYSKNELSLKPCQKVIARFEDNKFCFNPDWIK